MKTIFEIFQQHQSVHRSIFILKKREDIGEGFTLQKRSCTGNGRKKKEFVLAENVPLVQTKFSRVLTNI